MKNTHSQLPTMIDPNKLGPLLSSTFATLKGPIDSFNPRIGNPKTMQEILNTETIQPGIFRDCEMFDEFQESEDNDEPSETQKQMKLRRGTPLAQFIVELTKENLDDMGEDERSDSDNLLAWQLMSISVGASYSQAAMVEAAKRYFDLEKNGDLYDRDENGEVVLCAEAEFAIEQLEAAQNKIYPALDPRIARAALDKINNPDSDTGSEWLSAEVREKWHEFLHAKFDSAFEHVYAQYDPSQLRIDGMQLRDMTEAFMCELGLPMASSDSDNSAWKCEFDIDASGFRNKPGEKRVICGTRDVPLDKIGFEKLMMHEIMGHVWRAENGSRTGYMAFQKGLPGSIIPEEGFGILMESLWTGGDPDALSRDHFRYVATAYADGMYDSQKHSEQETYDYIKAAMERTGMGDQKKDLYEHVMRPFRGMPPGCIMRSNASYYPGKVDMMKYIEAQYRAGVPIEEAFRFLSAGKINPVDTEQVEMLRRAQAKKEIK